MEDEAGMEDDSLSVVAPSFLTAIPAMRTSNHYLLGMKDWMSPSCSP